MYAQYSCKADQDLDTACQCVQCKVKDFAVATRRKADNHASLPHVGKSLQQSEGRSIPADMQQKQFETTSTAPVYADARHRHATKSADLLPNMPART